MKKLNQNGFSPFETILLVLVIVALGFAGYVVYQRSKDSQNNQQTTVVKKETPTEESKVEVDEEAQKWELVTSRQNAFSIRIPDGWKVVNYGQSDNLRASSVSYKAGTKAQVENIEYAYAGDSPVRFSVTQLKDNERYSSDGASGTPFKLGDITGTKYYKKYPVEPVEGIGPLPGEEAYTYEFKTSGKITLVSYAVYHKNQYSEDFLKTNYNQATSDINQIELVERVVKTLQIK